MGKIIDVKAMEILDSRGNPTVQVEVVLGCGISGKAAVPSGASTGQREALELRDGGTRHLGKGVLNAVHNVIHEIAPRLIGLDSMDQLSIDTLMIELDGTDNKSRLGANAILGVSLAVSKASANELGIPLYRYIGGCNAKELPVPMMNILNGGAHADNNLDIQEFMIVPHQAPTFSEAIRMAAETFHALGAILRNAGFQTNVGDEGGYAPSLNSIEQALDYLLEAISRAGYEPGRQISLALDVAASEFAETSSGKVTYRFLKSQNKDEIYSALDLISLYEKWLRKYPLVSIEDGFAEEDWEGWKEFTKRLGGKLQIVGDDFFVTNTERIARGIHEKAANSVLIKLNQIGTLTETLAAIKQAKQAGFTNVISHRSGETSDTAIADLAVATSAGQIKSGSMSRGERIAKYNRLLWIEQQLGPKACYCNPFKS